jgi:IPT/TIG domain
MIEQISQIFSKNEIVLHTPAIAQTQALAGTPSTDLQNLADSYISDAMTQNSQQSGIKISNSVWGVRSFLNSADFYYVFQEMDLWRGTQQQSMGVWGGSSNNQLQTLSTKPNLLQPSPASTNCSQSTTSGMNWNVGGSAGWNQTQGANATLTGGVSVSNSTTISCPGVSISNQSDPGTGETQWGYSWLTATGGLQESRSYYNQWIWGIPFSSYENGQDSLQFQSTGLELFNEPFPEKFPVPLAQLTSTIPLPFGETFALQMPAVSSVSPASVKPGENFTITGTGLYPSLVTSVVIGGESVPVTQYSTSSDTQIQVTTPNQSGCDLPVVVQTGEGVSNDDVGINISGNSCQ